MSMRTRHTRLLGLCSVLMLAADGVSRGGRLNTGPAPESPPAPDNADGPTSPPQAAPPAATAGPAMAGANAVTSTPGTQAQPMLAADLAARNAPAPDGPAPEPQPIDPNVVQNVDVDTTPRSLQMLMQARQVLPTSQGSGQTGESIVLFAVNVNDSQHPNAKWSRATPSGNLQAQITNPDAYGIIQPDKTYLITIEEHTG